MKQINQKQLEQMHTGKGFIAALDQSGGSTPKALKGYGIEASEYHSDAEMFDLIHQMRSRVITSKAFTPEHNLGAILFQQTMDREIEGKLTADYLWDVKGVVPFLKVDKGLADEANGVQLMKPIPDLDALLAHAVERHIFGTKMRSVIKAANPEGIRQIVEQQFAVGRQIVAAGLVPILEPEVDIHIADKAEAERLLLKEVKAQLAALPQGDRIMLKVSIPTVAGLYKELMADPHMVRVVALSGGYSRQEADALLKKNAGLIASFSRALLCDLSAKQSQAEFDAALGQAVDEIYAASIT